MLKKWIICPCCHGEGRVDNPAFSNGFTSQEWADLGDDFDGQDETNGQQRYMRGDYDVACGQCKGAGKTQVPDVSTMTFAEKRVAAAERRDERFAAEEARYSAAERRMGA